MAKLQTLLEGLSSVRMAEKKKSCDTLYDYLCSQQGMKEIDKRNGWNDLFDTIKKITYLEVELLNKPNPSKNVILQVQKCNDLLFVVVKQANRNDGTIDFKTFMRHFNKCLSTNQLSEQCLSTCLKALREYIMPRCSYWGEITEEDWSELMKTLKDMYLQGKTQISLDPIVTMITMGALHRIPMARIRKEADFVKTICESATTMSERGYQSSVLEFFIEFCILNMNDSKTICCQLGEQVLVNFFRIHDPYSNHTKIPHLIFECLLIQLRIHYVNGSHKGDNLAFACSWDDWEKVVKFGCTMVIKILKDNSGILCADSENRRLHPTFRDVVVELFRQMDDMQKRRPVDREEGVVQSATKRWCSQSVMTSIVDDVASLRQWQWINLVSDFLQKYPQNITYMEFEKLLQFMAHFNTECRQVDEKIQVLRCLSTLIDVEFFQGERFALHSEKLEDTWRLIWETTVRSVGLNHHQRETHNLLRKFIRRKKQQTSNLLNVYLTKAVIQTVHSLKSLEVFGQKYGIPESVPEQTDNPRNILVDWVLNGERRAYYSDPITAQILTSLTLKQWPSHDNTDPESRITNFPYDDWIINKNKYRSYNNWIENKHKQMFDDDWCECNTTADYTYNDLCMVNKIVKDIPVHDKSSNVQTPKLYGANPIMTECLLDRLKEVGEEMLASDDEFNIINCFVLFANLAAEMDSYKNTEGAVQLLEMLTSASETFWKAVLEFIRDADKLIREREMDTFDVILRVTDVDKVIGHKIKEDVPVGFYSECFSILKASKSDTDDERKLERQSLILKLLLKISMECRSEIQRYSFNLILTSKLEVRTARGYHLAVTVLTSMKDRAGYLDADMLNILHDKLLLPICLEKYTQHNVALDIVTNLKHLLKHVANCDDGYEIKKMYLQNLNSFFSLRKNYGPRVSVVIVKCMGELSKLDPEYKWTQWSDEMRDVVFDLPEFLKSPSTAVRMTCVDVLVASFVHKQRNDCIIYNKQKLLFNVVADACKDLLESPTYSEKDEIENRTSTIFYVFAMIFINNGLLRQKALFEMIKLTYIHKLDIGKLKLILKKITKQLDMENHIALIESYINYLLTQWIASKYSLQEFPYQLFDSPSHSDFYQKYTTSIVPLLVNEEDKTVFENVCKIIGKSVHEIIQVSYSKIAARNIALESIKDARHPYKLNEHDVSISNNVKTMIAECIPEETAARIINEQAHHILIHVMQFIFDMRHFKTIFDTECKIPEPDSTYFSVEIFMNSLELLKEKIGHSSQISIIEHFISKEPYKIQQLLLNLRNNLYTSIVFDEHLLAFHRYVVFIELLVPNLKRPNNMSSFIIRDVTYTLINLSKYTVEDDTLNCLALKMLNKFFDWILPQCHQAFNDVSVMTISTLVTLVNAKEKLSLLARACIKKLVVDHRNCLKEVLKILDPFPDGEKFAEFRAAHLEIKYGDGDSEMSLAGEIECFLRVDNYVKRDGCRTEGLVHLRKQIVQKKGELVSLYAELYKMKGCLTKGSCLHKLICVLIRLSTSTDEQESLEATKCLGLLGPADLTTLVLKEEDNLDSFNLPPATLSAKDIITLLLEYIVNENNQVAMHASASLHVILTSSEGKQVIVKNHNEEMLNKAYLIPFMMSSKTKTSGHVKINEREFIQVVEDVELWCPTSARHDNWITNLVVAILNTFSETSFYRTLIHIVRIKIDFAEKLLPHLINVILDGYQKLFNPISEMIGNFFSKHWDYHWSKQDGAQTMIHSQKTSVQCMLDIVDFVRLQRSVFTTNRNLERPLLTLNYLEVALAAQFCSAYFSAVLYAEQWVRETALGSYDTFAGREDTYSMTPFDIICRTDEKAVQFQNILRETYLAIGDKDANYIKMSDPMNLRSCINMYKDLNRWDLVRLFCDKQAMKGEVEEVEYTTALKYYGLYHTINNSEKFKHVQYDVCWRLSQWDLNDEEPPEKHFDYHNYKALRAFSEDDIFNFGEEIALARRNVIDTIKNTSLEACKNLYTPLAQLQALQEFEELSRVVLWNKDLDQMIEGWNVSDSINPNTFECMEIVLSERICLMKILVNNGYEELKKVLIDTQLKLSELTRQSGNFIRAKRALFDIQYVENLDVETKARVLLEDGQIMWNIDKNMGISVLKHLLDTHQERTKTTSEALRLYGSWMMETHNESSKSVITNYFVKSVSILNELHGAENVQKSNNVDDFYESFNILAGYTDQEYQQIHEYTKSLVFQGKLQNIEQMENSVAEMEKKAAHSDLKKSIFICNRQIFIDRNETENVLKERDAYLDMTIKYYLNNLVNSDRNNINMFRIFSLWLENRDNKKILAILQEYLPNIPSHKIILILPQLVPHINNTDQSDSFVKEITTIIERCASEHPHHALPIIFSIANSNKDEQLAGKVLTKAQLNEPRIVASQNIIKRLKKQKHLNKTIVQLECLMDALMELAYLETPEQYRNSKTIQIAHNLKLMREVKHLTDTIVPTFSLPIDKRGKYNDIIGIYKYRGEYNLVGGLNAPKRLKCIGTDGIERCELVKGKDDLRQDAVMQQVFTIMNGLFTANKTTSNLLIRTYKVVPMSKRSGVLEWVNNTMTLGEYLAGKQGAHSVYNPTDISPEKCRDIFKRVAKEPYNVKLEKYLDICKKFKPVFHKFFETTFLQPTIWYEKRKAYTQSVATSSMCGYILGLGDRHVNNVLIDKTSGEVVHIDFGIAFDQGRALPTPETVPFRLSRDIESAMGVAGVNGTFRRSCEKTLEVLRNNDKTIFTILEVLLYDPLYEWTVSAEQAYKRQRDDVDSNDRDDALKVLRDKDSGQLNVRAERALNQLKEKLHGIEYGKLSVVSVEGQVGGLIAQARDPANLSKLFHGWQPYL